MPSWRGIASLKFRVLLGQVGDQLDRGGNEVRILYWLERLQKEATQHGGSLHILNGYAIGS